MSTRSIQLYSVEHQLNDTTIARAIIAKHNELAVPAQRRFAMANGHSIICYRSRVSNGDVVLHIVKYKSGETAGTVDFSSEVVDDDTVGVPPPENQEFVKSEVFCQITNDKALVLTSRRNQHLLTDYLRSLFRDENAGVVIRPVLNSDVDNVIAEEGIDSVVINATLSQFAAIQPNISRIYGDGSSILNSFCNFIADFNNNFFGPNQMDFIGERAPRDLRLSLSLAVGKGSFVMEDRQNAVNLIAGEVVGYYEEFDDDDGNIFVIKTKKGHRINRNKLLYLKQVNVSERLNAANSAECFLALAEYKGELASSRPDPYAR